MTPAHKKMYSCLAWCSVAHFFQMMQCVLWWVLSIKHPHFKKSDENLYNDKISHRRSTFVYLPNNSRGPTTHVLAEIEHATVSTPDVSPSTAPPPRPRIADRRVKPVIKMKTTLSHVNCETGCALFSWKHSEVQLVIILQRKNRFQQPKQKIGNLTRTPYSNNIVSIYHSQMTV